MCRRAPHKRYGQSTFNGPVRRITRLHDLARLVLRHTYGDVTAIASDNSSITDHQGVPTETCRYA